MAVKLTPCRKVHQDIILLVSLNYVDKRRYRAVDVEEIAFSFFEFDTIIFSECLHGSR